MDIHGSSAVISFTNLTIQLQIQNIQFALNFYGQNYMQLYVPTNGYITLRGVDQD